MTLLALYQRVGETFGVAARLPHFLIHHDCRVKTKHVLASIDKLPPPNLLDIFFQESAVVPVIPKTGEPAVNFRAGEHKPASFAERDDFFHYIFLFLLHGGPTIIHRTSYIFLTYLPIIPLPSFAPGSERDFVVSAGLALLTTSVPVKRSVPRATLSPITTGDVPTWLKLGISTTLNATSRGGVPTPTPDAMPPASHVTAPPT